MATVVFNLSKWYHYIIAALPILAFAGTAGMWIDTRYMHKEISDRQFVDIQIKIMEAQIREYTRRTDEGKILTSAEKTQFELDKNQLNWLTEERNRLMGIGITK